MDDAYNNGYSDRILIVKYNELTINPQMVMKRIHRFLGEEDYFYAENNFSDLKQTTEEYDGIYNYKFPHTIKEGGISYKKHEVKLPQHIVEKINTRFSWINSLV